MNKFLFSFAMVASVLLHQTPSTAVDIHVSSTAVEGGNGSAEKPFATLPAARDAIRERRKAGDISATEPVTVLLAPGTYGLDKTFDLTAADSGSPQAPVVYRAAKAGAVQIIGGTPLQWSQFQPIGDAAQKNRLAPAVRERVRVLKLAGESFPEYKTAFRGVPAGPWLFANGAPQQIARWPNADADKAGWAGFSKVIDTGLPDPKSDDPARQKRRPGAFILDDPRPARWNLEEGVWLLGYWTHDWSDEVIRIASYDADGKVISLAAPHNYGIKGGTWGAAERRFFALNVFEELDQPGEWYLNRKTAELYFYPPENMQPESLVLATLNAPLLRLTGTKHVRFENLNFEYSHAEGLVLNNTEHVEIAGCRVANLAGSGISINGSHNTVRSCDLYHLGKNGISLSGGDRKTLTKADNLAINNHIHHYGLFQRTYAPGIYAQGCGQVARHNRIHHAPHNAVLYGGNEHLFELNEIFQVVLETGDAGAFYTGRDWTSQGNVLRHNYVHDLGTGEAGHVNTMGVYLDDCDSGDTVEGNIFVRAGRALMIGGGRNNPMRNNVVIDCPIGIHIDARGMTWKQWNNPADPSWMLESKAEALNYRSPPWSERYPQLANIMHDSPQEPLYNPVQNNLFVNCSKNVCSFDGNVRKLLDNFEISGNVAVDSQGNLPAATKLDGITGFATLSGTERNPVTATITATDRGLQLNVSPEILREISSFLTIPVQQIGLVKDDYRKQLPSHDE